MIVFRMRSSIIADCHSQVEAKLKGICELKTLHIGQGLLNPVQPFLLNHHKFMIC